MPPKAAEPEPEVDIPPDTQTARVDTAWKGVLGANF
jgi:hypothetical protein